MDDEDEDILADTCSEAEDDEVDRQPNTQLSLIDHLAKAEKRPKRDQLAHNNGSSHFQATTNSIQSQQQQTGSNVHSSSLINSNHPQSIANSNAVASLQNLQSNAGSISSNANTQSLAHQHFAVAAAAKFAQDLSGLTAAQQQLHTAFGLQSTTTNNILNHNNSFVHSLANNTLSGQALTNGQLDPYNIHEHVQQQQTLQHLQHLHSLPLAHPHPAFLAALQKH